MGGGGRSEWEDEKREWEGSKAEDGMKESQ